MRHVKTVRQNDQAASWLACLRGDGCLYRRVVVNGSKRHRHPQGPGDLDLAVERGGESGVRVEDDGDPRDARRGLPEQLEPFSYDRRVVGAEPRDVAAGSREALNEALPDGIRHDDEHDRIVRVCPRSATSAGAVLARMASGARLTSSVA